MSRNKITSREILIELARMYGINEQVGRLISERNDPPLPNSLPSLLKKQRELLGVTRREICRRSGLSKSQAAAYERDKLKNPGLRTIAAIALGFELPLWVVLHAVMLDVGITSNVTTSIGQDRPPVRRRRRNLGTATTLSQKPSNVAHA